MAENTEQQQQQGKCPGNCSLCNMYQRNYCSSQISYTTMKIVTVLMQEVSDMKAQLKAISDEVAATYPKAGDLIDPTTEE